MQARFGRCVTLASLAALALPAVGQAAIWQNVRQGLQLFGYQVGLERSVVGNGWTANAVAVYNNRTFNAGWAEMTLNGVVRGSAGYRLSGIPSAQFSLNTGGQPLSYSFSVNNGVQDFDATGQILINIDTDINILGFYDTRIQISNRGSFTGDGFLSSTENTFDFDVGPINTSGNIFADALAVLTEPIFTARGVENPFAKFSAKATKVAELNRTTEELRARIAAGEVLSDEDIARLVNSTVLSSLLSGDTDAIFNGLPIPADILQASIVPQPAGFLPASVPEPAGMLLLGAAVPLFARARRTR